MPERGMGFNRRDFVRSAWTLPAAGAGYLAWEVRRRGGPVRTALVGCGTHGREVLLREAPANAIQWVAVCDPRAEARDRTRQELARLHGGAGAAVPAVAHPRDLFDIPGIDAVVIASPTPTHAGLAIDCLKNGKHVYIEAPLADNVFDAKAVAKYANSNRGSLIAAVGHQRAASPKYHAAAGNIASGGLGEIRFIEIVRHFNAALADPWSGTSSPSDKAIDPAKLGFASLDDLVHWRRRKNSGGVFGEYLAGHIDGLRRLFAGDDAAVRPLAVAGTGGKHLGGPELDIEDHAYLTFELPNDRIVTWACASSTGAEGYGELVLGTRGTMWLTNEGNLQTTYPPAPQPPGGIKPKAGGVKLTVGAATPGAPTMYSAASTASITATAASKDKSVWGFAEGLRAFADAIRQKNPALVACDVPTGLVNVVVAYAAQSAVRKKQRVVFDDRWFKIDDVLTPDDRPKDESLGKFAGLVG